MQSDSGVRLSVCMATYNGENYIYDQLLSILDQIGPYDEVIIVDDCSDDRTAEIIGNFLDKRIKLLRNTVNLGIIKSFGRAIKESSGEYIFLSDQDDLWMPDKVSTTLKCFTESGADVIVSDSYIMKSNIIELDTFYIFRNSKQGLGNNLIKNSFIGCCMAFKSHLKSHILPIPEKISMHDLWIGMVGMIYGTVIFIPNRLVIYRRHENNVTPMTRMVIKKVIIKRFFDTSIVARQVIRKLMAND